jgi:hypothetical protein
MSSHARLEQRSRKIIELSTGEEAIVATPSDYEVAYEVFRDTCQRTVVNLMRGFPSPARVRAWWDEDNPPPDGDFRNHQNTRNHWNTWNIGNQPQQDEEPMADIYQGNGHRGCLDPAGIAENHSRNDDSRIIPEDGISENGLDKPKSGDANGDIPGIPMIPGPALSENGVSRLTAEEVGTETRRAGSGPALALRAYLEKPNVQRLEYLTKAILLSKGMDPAGWESHADAVQVAASDPRNHPLNCECEECL